MQVEASSSQKNLLALFSAAVVGLHKEVRDRCCERSVLVLTSDAQVPLPVSDEAAFLDMLLRWVVTVADNALQRDAVVHTISSIVNKRIEGTPTEHWSPASLNHRLPPGLSAFLTDKLDVFWTTQVASTTQPPEKRREAILTWTWVTKALLVRGDPRAADHVDRFFQLFGDEEISWAAARAIGGVVAADNLLTKKNHAVIKFLYAQKYCTSVLPRIIEGAKSTDGTHWLLRWL